MVIYYPVHMGTGSNRFAELAKISDVLFHTDDLANLWHITSKNTLYTTIKRYVQDGLLFRIYKGFYGIKPLAEIDPLLLGIKALHNYAYVSTETILVSEGIIQQQISAITMISAKTKKFTIGNQAYYSRKIPDKFLYQPDGIIANDHGARKANRYRAVADLLYLNPNVYLDGNDMIDWQGVRQLQQKIGYPLTPRRYG